MWGKGGKAREGHEETSREVAYSEDVRLEVRVFHDLHREVIVRQTRLPCCSVQILNSMSTDLYCSDSCALPAALRRGVSFVSSRLKTLFI